MNKFTQLTPEELEDNIRYSVEAAIESQLNEIVHEASKKLYLNTREVMQEFNIPYRSQKHLRDTFQLAYTQYGRAIIYQRKNIIDWISSNRVKYKRILERQGKKYQN